MTGIPPGCSDVRIRDCTNRPSVHYWISNVARLYLPTSTLHCMSSLHAPPIDLLDRHHYNTSLRLRPFPFRCFWITDRLLDSPHVFGLLYAVWAKRDLMCNDSCVRML